MNISNLVPADLQSWKRHISGLERNHRNVPDVRRYHAGETDGLVLTHRLDAIHPLQRIVYIAPRLRCLLPWPAW